MEKLYRIIVAVITFISITSLNAQTSNPSVYNKSLCIIDLNFGYAAPAFDLSGSSTKDFYNFTGYGTSGGFNANITTKFSVANFSAGQIRTYLTIAYAQFNGSENRAYNISDKFPSGWPNTGYVTPKDTTGTSSVRINSPFIAYGWEIALFTDRERKSIINFGLDFDISVLFGRVYDKTSLNAEVHNNIIANTRMGLGFNLGYSYRVVNMLGLSLGSRLQISNLFSKSSEIVKDKGDLSLFDASLNPNIKSNRSIGFFGIYGGVSFYIGGSK